MPPVPPGGARSRPHAQEHAAALVPPLDAAVRIRDALQRVGAEDIVFVANGQLTRTSSGKMQRRAITQAFEAETIRMYVPREN